MPRGGYRKPEKPAAVSGPGKFSKRTDGQPKRAPDLDTPGQQYGDRQMIEAAQQAAPARGAAGAPMRRMQGEAMTGGRLPSYLFDMESANPGEPVTTGLSMGPGAGPEALEASQAPDDIREVVLEYLATEFQNPTAQKHLADLRAEGAAPAPIAQQMPQPMPAGPELNEEAESGIAI